MTQKFKETEIGMIPEDWEVVKFSNYAELKHGYQFRQYDFTEEGIKVFKITQIKSDASIDISSCSFIDFEREDKFEKFKIRKGDILMALTGATIGKIARFNLENETILQNYRVGNFVPKNEKLLSKDYLYYFLSSKIFFNQILARQTQSAQQNIGKDEINQMLLFLPPLFEQKAIAKILSDLDSKIELLQKQNEILEKAGKAIFKQWFVDFEFPDEKGKPYKSSGGKMVDSDLGKVPDGWKVDKLGEFIDVQRGLSYKGKFLSKDETDIPMINLGTIAPYKGYRREGIKFYTGEHKERHTVKTGDIVIANTDITQKRDVLGSPAIVPFFDSEEILFTHHIYAVRNEYFPNLFLYYLFQKPDYKERAVTFATGTTVLALPKDAILDYKFVIPSEEVFNKFGVLAQSIFDKIILNNKDLLSLQKTRDLLLPKLMSGKIRVPIEVKA